jgi:hypothetical protein
VTVPFMVALPFTCTDDETEVPAVGEDTETVAKAATAIIKIVPNTRRAFLKSLPSKGMSRID